VTVAEAASSEARANIAKLASEQFYHQGVEIGGAEGEA
jgi:hypothetical protein